MEYYKDLLGCFVPSCKKYRRDFPNSAYLSIPPSLQATWCYALGMNCPKRNLSVYTVLARLATGCSWEAPRLSFKRINSIAASCVLFAVADSWWDDVISFNAFNETMHGSILEQLERDGYVVLEEFLRAGECAELSAAGRELARGAPPPCPGALFSTTDPENQQLKYRYMLDSNDKISHFYEKDAVNADGTLQVDSDFSLNKVGHALHLLHPLFRCYTYSDRVRAACRALALRDPAVVQSMYIYKNPGIGGEVVPHQDITFLHTEPIPPIGFWIALEDASIENGCLWMARGSHKSGVHRRLLRSPECREKLVYDRPSAIYPESSFTPVPVSAGTCIIIHGNVVHKSASNRSDRSRHAYTFHVIEKSDNNYSPDNWLQEGPNAPFLNLYTTPQIE